MKALGLSGQQQQHSEGKGVLLPSLQPQLQQSSALKGPQDAEDLNQVCPQVTGYLWGLRVRNGEEIVVHIFSGFYCRRCLH